MKKSDPFKKSGVMTPLSAPCTCSDCKGNKKRKAKHLCNRCDNLGTIFDVDPYTKEMSPEDLTNKDFMWWCENCFQVQLDEI